jgi:hypothetical protein
MVDLKVNRCLCLVGYIIVAFLFGLSAGQELPAFNASKFDPSANFRSDLCERQRQLFVGNITLARALEGLDLSVSLPIFRDPVEKYLFTLDKNGAIEQSFPLLFAIILDELADRAGFRWRNSFAAFEQLDTAEDGNKTYSDLIEWEVDAFDIAAGRWDRSLPRLNREISFPEGFYDSSIILVHVAGNSNSKLMELP